MTVGPSSWVAVPSESDKARFYFSKFSAAAYYTLLGIKGYVGIRLLWTAQLPASSPALHRVAPGDFGFYFGRRLAFVEPRLGLKIPLYRIGDNPVWIGSRNTRLTLGLGLNANVREENRVNISSEISWNVYLNSWPDSYALPHNPNRGLDRSWDLEPLVKASIRPVDRLRVGVEILGAVKRVFYDAWLPDGVYEIGLSITPHGFVEYDLGPTVSLSAKAGFGWSFKGLGPAELTNPYQSYLESSGLPPAFRHAGYAVNISVGMNWYP